MRRLLQLFLFIGIQKLWLFMSLALMYVIGHRKLLKGFILENLILIVITQVCYWICNM